MTGVIRERTSLLDPHPLLGFDGDSAMKESGVLLASSAASLGGVNEVQTVTITGTPTGGTFTLTFDGATTANIAFNANAATVAAAVAALPNVGTGNVAGGGGALPGTAVTITFQGSLAKREVPQMTANGAGLTGGTTPAVAVTTTTPGSSVDSTVYKAKRSLILEAGGSGNSKLVPWAGSNPIIGVLADTVLFFSNTSPENDRACAVYKGPGLTFNADSLAAVQPAVYTGGGITTFATWAQANGNRVGNQDDSQI